MIKLRSNFIHRILVSLAALFGWLFCHALASAQVYLTPGDVVVPESASQAALDQSAGQATLRVAGLDVFPHADVTVLYDDNLLISHTNQLSDVEWTLSPGFTVVAGDVSTYLPGSITLAQLRGLLDYSLVEDSAKPQRFVGVDYTPSVNIFTDHSTYTDADHRAGMSAGYTLSKLALGLDQNYSRVAEKDNEIGSRVFQDLYETKLKSRYDLTDRSSFEVNATYTQLDYETSIYQGFQEFRNDDWYNRQVGAKATAGLGVVFGFVFPDVNANQTYQQLLLRGVYRLTDKTAIRLSAGGEYREYDGRSDTLDPVISATGIYTPTENTTFTLDAHRFDSPSPYGDFNYVTLGVYAGVQQRLFGKWWVELTGGYDSIDYVSLQSGPSTERNDGYYSLRVSVNYQFSRHLNAMVFYTRREDDSSIDTFTYDNNMVGLQVGWRF